MVFHVRCADLYPRIAAFYLISGQNEVDTAPLSFQFQYARDGGAEAAATAAASPPPPDSQELSRLAKLIIFKISHLFNVRHVDFRWGLSISSPSPEFLPFSSSSSIRLCPLLLGEGT